MKPTNSVVKPGLARVMGPLTAAAVVIGTVIGSGVFKKPQTVAANVPFFGLAALTWIGVGVFVLLGALAYAEVAVLFPQAGGNYVFLREAYGRLAGFLWGWVEFLIIRAASLAALATIFTESLHDVLRNPALQKALGLPSGDVIGFWPQKLVTVAVIVGLALVNVRGVRWGGGLQVFVTLVKVASLLAIIAAPLVVLVIVGAHSEVGPQTANLSPTWPDAWSQVPVTGLGVAFLGVYWAYHGWMNITPVAEEVREPQRNIPLSLLAGVGTVLFLYVGANLAYNLILPQTEIAGLKDTTTATAFSLKLLGPLGAAFASAAVMCSVFGALNGNLLVGPRLLYAMGKDGLAPPAMRDVHPHFRTPVVATLVLAAWACALVMIAATLTWTGLLDEKQSTFDALTDFAMFGSLTFETLAVMTIFVFRWRLPHANRPYRCLGYPITPLLYLLLPGFVLASMAVKDALHIAAGVSDIAGGAFEAGAREVARGLYVAVGVTFIAVGAGVYYLLRLNRRPPNQELATDEHGLTQMKTDPPPDGGNQIQL